MTRHLYNYKLDSDEFMILSEKLKATIGYLDDLDVNKKVLIRNINEFKLELSGQEKRKLFNLKDVVETEKLAVVTTVILVFIIIF